jgi:transposase-like protein
MALPLGAVRSLAACNRLGSRVAAPLAGCKTQALARPPPLRLVAGMWVTIASPTGACRLEAQGRRRAVQRKPKRVGLSALGVWPDGPWDIGPGQGAAGERADTWQACFGALSRKGVTEATTALVISDGATGLERALAHQRYGVAPHRGLFSKSKQLADHVVCGELKVEPRGDAEQTTRQAKRQRKKAGWVEARWVEDGASETHMRERAAGFRQAWAERAPDAGANFLVDVAQTFADVSSAFPEPFRGLSRTTNRLERFQKERRRKQRDSGMFQSEPGCETLWYVLARRETAQQRARLQSRL